LTAGVSTLLPGRARSASFALVESGWRLIVVALACLISVFLDQATGSMTQALQPYMEGTAGASVDEGTWLAISYNTCYYLSLIASPWMISRFGRRPVWVWGHALFAATSLGIAASQSSLDGMVALRAVQGLGQGTFFVCAVMTVFTVFPLAIRWIGFAVFATSSLSGPAAASSIGGFFVDSNDWPLAFVAIALLATLASGLVAFGLKDPPREGEATRLDTIGIALAFVHYFTYHYVSQFGERRDWFGDPGIIAMTALFAVATVAFFGWELRTSWPFIPVSLFAKSHNLRWGSFLGFILGVPLFGGNIILQYLETQLGFTPTLAGEELLLRITTIVLVVPFVAYALPRRLVDPRVMIIVGFVLVAGSYSIEYLGTTATADFGTFAGAFVMQGAGFSLLFSPIASTVLSSIPPEDFTRGVAIFKLSLATGGSFAATMFGVVIDHRAALHLTQIADGMTLANPGLQSYLFSGGKAGVLPTLAASQSQILAYADAALYTAILVLCVAPLALVLRPPRG
jgi:MFS transporter, DHA2 family, multidrug resistance protein